MPEAHSADIIELKLIVRKDDVEMLLKLRDFLDDLIETIEVMSDEELLKEIEEALEDVRKGRLVTWEEFLRESRR